MKIMWTNKFSGETGFVKMIKPSKNCFVNTFDKEDARKFRSEAEAKKAIESLIAMGEGENNTFSIVE